MTNPRRLATAQKEAAKVIKASGISLQQQQFLNELFRGRNVSDAATVVGYSGASAGYLLQHANVQRVMGAAMRRFLESELAPSALGVLYKLLQDDRTPAGVRKDIAFGLLDRAGFASKRGSDQPGDAKDVAQMTAPQLQAEIDRLQREIDVRMVDVTPDGETNSEPSEAQLIEMYE